VLHRPSLFNLPIRSSANPLGIVGRVERSADASHENILQVAPVNIWSKFLAADSCKILNDQATLFRNATRDPVGYRLRFRLATDHLGELALTAGPLDCSAESFRSDVWIRCLHAHSISHRVSFDKIFVSLRCEPRFVSDGITFAHG
jgi:hypothetical protein